jgi:hypothetical protein
MHIIYIAHASAHANNYSVHLITSLSGCDSSFLAPFSTVDGVNRAYLAYVSIYVIHTGLTNLPTHVSVPSANPHSQAVGNNICVGIGAAAIIIIIISAISEKTPAAISPSGALLNGGRV